MRRFALAMVLGPALFCLTPSGFAQADAGAKVTFTTRAARLEQILPGLAKAANVPLEATAVMQGEVLVISVKDVPLKDLLDKIAAVTSAEWKPIEGGGFRLVQSNSLRGTEERQALAARVAALQKSVKDHLKKPEAPAPAGKDGKNTVSVSVSTGSATASSMGPDNDAIYRIISRTDLAGIAALGSGERIVYSTQPTRMQRAFTGNVTDEINALVKQHNSEMAKNGGDVDAQLAQMPDFVKKMAERMTKPIGVVSKALLVVSRMSFASFGMVSTELRLYGPDGKVAYSMPGMLDLPGEGLGSLMENMDGLIPGAKTTPQPATTTPVETSPDTDAMLKAFQGVSVQPNKGLPLSPDLRAKIFHPDKFDPLSFLVTDQVLSMAKKLNKPVVAELPDDAVSMLTMVMPGKKPTVEDFEKNVERKASLQLVPDSQWLIIKPAKPAEARANRLDRDALAALMKVTEEKGLPSLDDIAAYSLKAPSPMEGGLGQMYALLFVPGIMSNGMMGITNWETMRFYGSLDPSARNTLFSGGQIPFAGFTSYQQQQVSKMIYGAMPALEVDDPNKKDDGMGAMGNIMKAFMGGGGDYQEEPTELLPNGLPGNGFVKVAVSKEPFASPVVPDGSTLPGTMAVMDAEMLATFKMLKENQEYAAFSAMIPSPDKVRVGEKTSLAFTFQVAPKVAAHQTLNDNRLPSNAAVISMSELPDSFQKLIAFKMEAVKKSPLGALGSIMGGLGGTIKP